MNSKRLPAYWVRIYMSGPIEVAKQYLRGECAREGLCVTIDPTTFIYSGGEESGFVVGLIDYPKFPKGEEAVWARALVLRDGLLAATHQDSALLMDARWTDWVSKRGAV